MEDLTFDDVDYYEKLNMEMDNSLAIMKKSLDAFIDMRVEAAFMELEYTCMLEANCWKEIGEMTEYAKEEDTAIEDTKNT